MFVAVGCEGRCIALRAAMLLGFSSGSPPSARLPLSNGSSSTASSFTEGWFCDDD